MRIDNSNASGVNASAAGANQKVRPADEHGSAHATAAPGGKGSDEVLISNVASQLSLEGLKTDQSLTAERAAKIDLLTKLVQSGQYHPDPDKLAESIIGDMLTDKAS